MSNDSSSFVEHAEGEKRWYDLFSRGARDWLRHNDKVSRAVRDKLPELISDLDVLGSKAARTLRVPVRFLEHYRFRLSNDQTFSGVGQGKAEPGDTLVAPSPEGQDGPGQGGNNEGGYQFVLELNLDDVVDWFWEELELPHLKRKDGRVRESDYSREGWNRRGVQSRLDRRRSVKEALKRRARGDGPSFTNDDLRFRQLVMRKKPSTEAVVFFAMDVSSSMTDRDRKLAKTFFFWVIQGLRRQYTEIEPVFIAHTVEAWEFAEDEFFQVTASGGTVASSAFDKTLAIIDERYDPGRYNIYLFYVSDGANFSNDADAAREALRAIGNVANFVGYAEVQNAGAAQLSPMGAIFDGLRAENPAIGSYPLADSESVWHAIRAFFTAQADTGA